MAHDSLGKKTHLGCALHLFWNANKIWGTGSPVDPIKAVASLRQNEGFEKSFSKKGWPRDIRSVQAYVHRFFRWLELKREEREIYPTVILSTRDVYSLVHISLNLVFVSLIDNNGTVLGGNTDRVHRRQIIDLGYFGPQLWGERPDNGQKSHGAIHMAMAKNIAVSRRILVR